MKKCVLILLIMFVVVFSTSSIYATNDWWGSAFDFLEGFQGSNTQIGGPNSDVTVGSIIGNGLNSIIELIKTVGNLVFVAVTVILGVKYIWGSVESKASVKDSMVTLVVAAVVFYGWNTISNLFMDGSSLSFIQGNAESTVEIIYHTIMVVCNFLAIGGIVYVGIRYLLAGAEGRAELKTKSVPIVLGIIMVYATFTFLSFIINGTLDFFR